MFWAAGVSHYGKGPKLRDFTTHEFVSVGNKRLQIVFWFLEQDSHTD